MLFMGKSTISMAIFNSYVSHNQRVYSSISQYYPNIIPLLSHYHPYKTILNHIKPIKIHSKPIKTIVNPLNLH